MTSDRILIAGTLNPAKVVDELVDLGVDPGETLRRIAEVHKEMSTSITESPTREFLDDLATLKPTEAAHRLQEAAEKVAASQVRDEVWQQARSLLQRSFRTAVTEAESDLIEQARPGYDKATAELAKIVSTLGAADPDPSEVLSQGPKAVEAWNKRQAVTEAAEKAAKVAVTIAKTLGRTVTADLFIESATDVANLEKARQAYKEGGLAGLIECGPPLRLNTKAEADNIAAVAQANTDKANREVEEARRQPTPEEADRNRRTSKAWRDTVATMAASK